MEKSIWRTKKNIDIVANNKKIFQKMKKKDQISIKQIILKCRKTKNGGCFCLSKFFKDFYCFITIEVLLFFLLAEPDWSMKQIKKVKMLNNSVFRQKYEKKFGYYKSFSYFLCQVGEWNVKIQIILSLKPHSR